MRFREIALAIIFCGATAYGQWSPPDQTSGPIYYTGGNVGIGTENPGQKLEVFGTMRVNSGGIFLDNDRAIRAGGGNQSLIYRSSSNGIFLGSGDTNDFLVFNAGGVARVRITESGSVGIGTSSPSQKLHVEGNIHVSGNINAKYQDIAEWVPSDGGLEPGTVVVLDPLDGSRVTASRIPYDMTVAGVVSPQPGILLGDAGPTKAKVATTGRVRVRVDATTLPIRVGDLLVTSEKTGVAMRSEPMEINGRRFHQPGTILGKALEPFDGSSGEILVLLSLQ